MGPWFPGFMAKPYNILWYRLKYGIEKMPPFLFFLFWPRTKYFVQKDWVNGLSSLGPDEEGIGSTIIIFCHKINVVLLKKKRYTHCGHCKEDFRGGECLEEHVLLFMKRDLL